MSHYITVVQAEGLQKLLLTLAEDLSGVPVPSMFEMEGTKDGSHNSEGACTGTNLLRTLHGCNFRLLSVTVRRISAVSLTRYHLHLSVIVSML
jgi:hypothetical protein